jgi:hypothetical protein|tara:strand:- start:38 stop:328 length:291 start_codon:yes stop_codon:yes gene_type:complete
MVDFLAGVLAIAAAILAILAGLFAIHMFHMMKNEERLKPWKILLKVLILFTVVEVLGVLKYFDIYTNPFLTHVIPGIMLGLLMYAIVLEIHIAKSQ